jgi:hypothetical protein
MSDKRIKGTAESRKEKGGGKDRREKDKKESDEEERGEEDRGKIRKGGVDDERTDRAYCKITC